MENRVIVGCPKESQQGYLQPEEMLAQGLWLPLWLRGSVSQTSSNPSGPAEVQQVDGWDALGRIGGVGERYVE